MFEYRSGFPDAVNDAYQNYVGLPYANRFPTFVSLDSRFSKDIEPDPKYTIRPCITVFNMTKHFNPRHSTGTSPTRRMGSSSANAAGD
ncbi:MAG: hypothetical protein ACLQKA_15630 [Bryobacteraceae bacterium]